MKQSSKDFFRMFTDAGGGPDAMLDGYLYLRWISRYLYHLRRGIEGSALCPDDGGEAVDELIEASIRTMLPGLMKRETSTYHGKVVTLEEAGRVVTIGREVSLPSLPETVIPYSRARDLILRDPDHITVIDCPCRTSKEGHCTPVDVCMVVGEPFAGFLLEHGTANARKLDREEALATLEETDRRGWVHSAWFKESLAGRFWVICNCCRCCCMAMKSHFLSIPMIASSGYLCSVGESCTGCGDCDGACPFGALTVGVTAAVDPEKCMGCGICRRRCGAGALSLVEGHGGIRPLGEVLPRDCA